MRAVVQRATRAKVVVDSRIAGAIQGGLAVFLAAGKGDTFRDASYLARKIIDLRVFPNEEGRMSLGLLDVGGELLVISQFTLYGNCNKGRRPSFVSAMDPKGAADLIDCFCSCCRDMGVIPQQGVFGAMMEVEIVNDGPLTLLLDSRKTF